MKVSKNSAFEKYSQNTINKTIKVLIRKDCALLKQSFLIYGGEHHPIVLKNWYGKINK